jgi:3-isopropylmalate/(R)-2-methylmalate dehydratase large subunit
MHLMKTLFDKIWDKHLVREVDESTQVLAIDRHYIHEVTSPQAFDSLKDKGVKVSRPDLTTATADHNVPTINQHLPIENELSRKQLEMLSKNCEENDIELYGLGDEENGIVHVIGPELGLTQPGMTIVCGDSHTSTHGAFGAIAFGIGTSQVAQVLAAQAVLTARPKTMLILLSGSLNEYVTSKDLILHIIKELGADYGTGYFIEFAGSTISNMSMESRMTVCNMSIEMGARGGLIAPDQVTFDYLKNKKHSADLVYANWNDLISDGTESFDKVVSFNAQEIEPTVTFGTNPGMGIGISEKIKTVDSDSFRKALRYMGLTNQDSIDAIEVKHVFIGSCTNGRYEDFKAAADIVRGKKKSPSVRALLVPGSNAVLSQINEEGLDKVFEEAGFEIRQPGCSACLAMNGDTIPSGEYCVSTSNRNFEGRQGAGARTILASPVMAAVAAINGRIIDPRKL